MVKRINHHRIRTTDLSIASPKRYPLRQNIATWKYSPDNYEFPEVSHGASYGKIS